MAKIRTFHSYNPEDMKKALKDVRENGTKLLTAATKWNVPKTTLIRLRDQNLTSPRKMGPPSVLSMQEEELLVMWMLESKERSFPISQEQLLYSVKVST